MVIEFDEEAPAIEFERYLKTGSGREFARRHFRQESDERSFALPLSDAARRRHIAGHIDRVRNRSYADDMNLQVPPELEAKLTRLAAKTGCTADQVALDLLASSVDHDEWFRAEVEKGRAAAREGRLIEHDDAAARIDH